MANILRDLVISMIVGISIFVGLTVFVNDLSTTYGVTHNSNLTQTFAEINETQEDIDTFTDLFEAGLTGNEVDGQGGEAGIAKAFFSLITLPTQIIQIGINTISIISNEIGIPMWFVTMAYMLISFIVVVLILSIFFRKDI